MKQLKFVPKLNDTIRLEVMELWEEFKSLKEVFRKWWLKRRVLHSNFPKNIKTLVAVKFV